jgi:hypothetical protein
MAFFNSAICESAIDIGLESSSHMNCDSADSIEYMDEAFNEYHNTLFAMEAAMYSIDSRLETSLYEGMNVESLVENALTDFIQKAKDAIISLWRKFQDTVTQIMMKAKAFFSASAGFVSKNSTMILKRAEQYANKGGDDGYEWSGYSYGVIRTGKDDIADELYKNTKASDITKTIDANDMVNTTASDEIRKYCSDLGDKIKTKSSSLGISPITFEIDDISSANSAYAMYLRGMYATNSTIVKGLVQGWIDACKNASKTLQNLGKTRDTVKRAMNDAISEMKKLESKAKKDDKTTQAANIRETVKALTQTRSLITRLATTSINIHVEGYKAFARRLREISKLKDLDKNKNGENSTSTESYYYNYDSSILESAMDEFL